jgi:hypothetical protein
MKKILRAATLKKKFPAGEGFNALPISFNASTSLIARFVPSFAE